MTDKQIFEAADIALGFGNIKTDNYMVSSSAAILRFARAIERIVRGEIFERIADLAGTRTHEKSTCEQVMFEIGKMAAETTPIPEGLTTKSDKA